MSEKKDHTEKRKSSLQRSVSSQSIFGSSVRHHIHPDMDHILDPGVVHDIPVCLLGGSVGKTSLVHYLQFGEFVRQFQSVGIQESFVRVDDFGFIVYDTPGDTDFMETLTDTIRLCEGFIFVFSVLSRESLESVAVYSQIVANHKLYQQVKIPSLLIGMKCDDEEHREVQYEEGVEYAKLMDTVYMEASAVTGLNIQDIFVSIGEQIKSEREGFGQARVSKMERQNTVTIGNNRDKLIKVRSNEDLHAGNETYKKKKRLNLTKTISRVSRMTSSKKKTDTKFDHAGWLTKIGAIVHSARRRWFILTEGVMKYYSDDKKKTLKGHFKLTDGRLRVPVHADTFSFEIETPNRTWKLSADTKKEMENWIFCIKYAMCPDGNYGILLEDIVKRCIKKNYTDIQVPYLVQVLIIHLRSVNAKELEGIFRISGNNQKILDLKEFVDYNDDKDFRVGKKLDVFSVCGALKLFFRELPDPLITHDCYESFIELQGFQVFLFINSDISNENIRVFQLKMLLEKLPECHYCTLKYLIEYLHEVSECSHLNKMTTQNLAVVFGPTLCRPPPQKSAKALFGTMKKQYGIVRDLITHFEFLFFD
eukprot:TRINITY_DN3443_c0_g1_i1.p1 TRINITY_DN3443_c0_g1~~TRINITY_DN3443_c0_g1_i1.p1  ORF type:complete len:591 (+),score=119.26 TRINITY_DN3443_c0_g1_i1:46-1818(+)